MAGGKLLGTEPQRFFLKKTEFYFRIALNARIGSKSSPVGFDERSYNSFIELFAQIHYGKCYGAFCGKLAQHFFPPGNQPGDFISFSRRGKKPHVDAEYLMSLFF